MNRSGLGFGALAFGLLLSATLVACGGGTGGTGGKTDGGGNGLGDGFIASGCDTVKDCVPNKCQTAKCNAATKMCQYTDRTCASDTTCPAETACSTSVCNVDDGTWQPTPTNDGMACTTSTKAPGMCSSGSCAAIPTCYGSNSFASIACDSGSSSLTRDSNDPSLSSAAATVSSYACAPNELGPEVGYRISTDSSLTTDFDVTVSLKLTDANGVVLADQTGVDLDLIILADVCAGTSACANPAAGAAFQGITTGTSAERVTFRADHSKKYYAVVDGKNLNQIGNYVLEVESCGQCAAKSTSQLVSCNMSVAVQASTSTGTNLLNNYTCVGATNPVVLAGNEIPFLFKDESGVARTVNASISGATSPATLLAISESYYGACNPQDCLGAQASSGGSASVSFATSSSGSFKRYWLLVDTPSTADSTFGLSLDCPAYCSSSDYATCIGTSPNSGYPTGSGSTTVSGGGYSSSTQYGPANAPCGGLTGLTGPEQAIKFTPSITSSKTYQVMVTASTTGVNQSFVVVDAGSTTTTCSPADVCAQNLTPVAGTGLSGTLTTVGSTAAAAATFLAEPGHVYYVIVDSKDAVGGDFSIVMSGKTSGAGCGM